MSMGKYRNWLFCYENDIIRSRAWTILFLTFYYIPQCAILAQSTFYEVLYDVTGVIWPYPSFFVNNSWQNWARASEKAPMCSEWAAKSNDMQHDYPRSKYWPGQPWPDLDLRSTWNLTFSKQKVHYSTRLGKTNTMVPEFLLCEYFCRSYLLKFKPRHLGHWPGL